MYTLKNASLLVSVMVSLVVGIRGDEKADTETIAKFLTTYLKTPFAERGKYVVDPKEFDGVQQAYYKGKPMPDEVQVTVKSVKAGPAPDYMTVEASVNASVSGMKATLVSEYYLLKTNDGYKLDWGAVAGYNPIGFKAWAAGNDNALTLRVVAKLSDYYNFHYGNAERTHYSIAFYEHFLERFDSFHGYVPKDLALGRKLFDIIKDGQEHRMTVTIQRTGRESSVVGITQLINDTWVKVEPPKPREPDPIEKTRESVRSLKAAIRDAEDTLRNSNATPRQRSTADSNLKRYGKELAEAERRLADLEKSKAEEKLSPEERAALRKKEAEAKAKAEEEAGQKKAEASAKAKRDRDESASASKLKQAKALAEDGKTADAREYCEEILKKYPQTQAAEEAKALLEKLKGKK